MEALAKSPERRYQSAEDLRSDLMRFSEGQPVRAAQRDVAFFGSDATRAVSKVAPGERTQAVPMMTGPRTDIRERRSAGSGIIVMVIILLLVGGGLAYFLTQKTTTVNGRDAQSRRARQSERACRRSQREGFGSTRSSQTHSTR